MQWTSEDNVVESIVQGHHMYHPLSHAFLTIALVRVFSLYKTIIPFSFTDSNHLFVYR